MNFPLPVDRGVSDFLSVLDFVSFRCVSREQYRDHEAWQIRASVLPLHCVGLGAKQTVGLHYLLGCSLRFASTIGSTQWLQTIVNWLESKSSIRIMYHFFMHFFSSFFIDMRVDEVCCRRRFLWLRLYQRKSRLFKRKTLESAYNVRPVKRMVVEVPVYGNIQQCCG